MKYKVLHVVGGMNKGGTETMLMNIYRKVNRDRIQFDFLYFTDEETYYDKEIIEPILMKNGLNRNVRAEELTVSQIVGLSNDFSLIEQPLHKI